jgi:hypothetical protein
MEELSHAHHGKYWFRKIVLTTPYALDAPDAKAQYRRLKKCVVKLLDRMLPKDWRKSQGAIVADEFGPNGRKLHFHVLFYGQWLDNRGGNGWPLASAWQAVTDGDCTVAWVGGVKVEDAETELVETVKYCVKFWGKNEETGDPVRLPPALMVALHELLRGQKRVRTYGIFYNLPSAPDRPVTCPVCGREMERMSWDVYRTFKETGWLYADQVLNLRTADKSRAPPVPEDNLTPEPVPDTGVIGRLPAQMALPGQGFDNVIVCYRE